MRIVIEDRPSPAEVAASADEHVSTGTPLPPDQAPLAFDRASTAPIVY